jgi:hypothetical protein
MLLTHYLKETVMSSITKVKKIAKVINTLVTGNSDVVVTVGGSIAFSEGGRINIPFGDFSNPEYMRMCHGYIDHETGHEAWTEHDTMVLMRSRYGEFGARIQNALEDARMEKLQGQRFPGAKINLETLWEDMIAKGYIINPFEMKEFGRVIFSYVNNTARRMVCGYVNNYSDAGYEVLSAQLGNAFVDELTALIQNTVNAKSTHDVYNIACEICELLQQQEEQPPTDQSDESDSDDSDDADSESETDDEAEGDSGNSDEADSESDADDEAEGDSGNSDDADSESDTDDEAEGDSDNSDEADSESDTDDEAEDDSGNSDDADSESNTDDEAEDDSDNSDEADSESDTDDEAEDDSGNSDDADSESDTDDEAEGDSGNSDDTDSESDTDDEAEGNSDNSDDADSESDSSDQDAKNKEGGEGAGNPLSGKLTDIDDEDYHEQIAEILSEMATEDESEISEFTGYDIDILPKPFVEMAPVDGWRQLSSSFARTLQRVLIDNSESLKMGANSGRKLLDRSIAQIPAGKKNVFEYKEENEAPVSSVELLVDASGSMNSNNKMVEANKTALAFAKAFQRMGIDIEVNYFGVYDYERNKNTIYQAKKFGEKLKPSKFNVAASGSTPTHDALFFGLTRIVNQQSDNKIIIVVTDGHPDERQLLVNTVEMTKKTGVKIVPIGLGTKSVKGFTDSVYAATSEDVNSALKQAIKMKLF